MNVHVTAEQELELMHQGTSMFVAKPITWYQNLLVLDWRWDLHVSSTDSPKTNENQLLLTMTFLKKLTKAQVGAACGMNELVMNGAAGFCGIFRLIFL